MRAAQCELSIIPTASHLFEEPGTLEEVARLARAWFELYLVPASAPERRAAAARQGPEERL